jgi:hypothetical protein
MAQDWIFNEESFEDIKRNKIWYSHETRASDIIDSCMKNNIVQIYPEEFDKSVWFCGVKTL